MSTNRIIVVNGKQIVLPPNATVRDAKERIGPESLRDHVVELDSRGDSIVPDDSPVKDGGRYQTIPQIIKGTR